MKEYDVIVYRGRFQGMHEAHLKTILMGLQLAKKVVVVVGSANEPRTFWRNPFFENERIAMLQAALSDHFRHEDVVFTTVEDHPDDYVWAYNVVTNVNIMIEAMAQTGAFSHKYPLRVGQIGYKKDDNCVRDVALFPEWEYINTPHFAPLDATAVREVLFSKKPLEFLLGVCPAPVIEWLACFRTSEEFDLMMQEKEFCENYQKKFDGLEFAPTFVTGDNVPIQNHCITLIKRKTFPGKGLWAVPAGFLNAKDRKLKDGTVQKADKSVFDCALREFAEETQGKITKGQLIAARIGEKMFDAEGRDPRGRFCTMAYAYDLDNYPLLETEAADDAEECKSFHISEIDRRMMYADHYDMIHWAYNLYLDNKIEF